MVIIESSTPYHNPYQFKGRDIRLIYLYDPKTGEKVDYRRWFNHNGMSGNSIKKFELPVEGIKKKLKYKADGTVFVMTAKEWDGLKYNLYIPTTMVNYTPAHQYENETITLTGEFWNPYLDELERLNYRKEYTTKTFKLR